LDHRLLSIITALLTVCLLVVSVSVLLSIAAPPEAAGASGTTFHVNDDVCPALGSGTPIDPYCRIQTAVDGAAEGDEIHVAAGTYTGAQMVVDSRTGYTYTQVVFIDKDLTLRGGYDAADWGADPNPTANPTVIDAEGSGRGVSIVGWTGTDALSVTIDGFTITGGDYTGLGNPPGGGWQVCHEAEGIDCGGGLYATWSALVLRDSTISDNIASGNDYSHGGGIYLYRIPPNSTGVRIEDTLIANNSAPGSGGGGGGMFVDVLDAPLILTHSTFQGNDADSVGGGMRLYNMGQARVTVENTHFISNASKAFAAGGAYIPLSSDGDALIMEQVHFQNNHADGLGGAALLLDVSGPYGPRARLNNLIFGGNRNANNSGAVLSIYNGASAKPLEVEMAHVTAANNQAATFLYAGAWGADRRVTTTLTNTLLVSFTHAFAGSEGLNGEVLIRHTNTLTDNVSTLHRVRDGSPTFEAIDPLSGDARLDATYHLRWGSAAIDAGVDAGVMVDIDGDSRVKYAPPDIGADEFTSYRGYLPLLQRGR
jgi:hypothetical protein